MVSPWVMMEGMLVIVDGVETGPLLTCRGYIAGYTWASTLRSRAYQLDTMSVDYSPRRSPTGCNQILGCMSSNVPIRDMKRTNSVPTVTSPGRGCLAVGSGARLQARYRDSTPNFGRLQVRASPSIPQAPSQSRGESAHVRQGLAAVRPWLFGGAGEMEGRGQAVYNALRGISSIR